MKTFWEQPVWRFQDVFSLKLILASAWQYERGFQINMDFEQITVTNNEADHEYEVKVDDQVAVLTYEREGNQITFLHTGVPPELEGHGIASKLAKHALDDARQQQLEVIPSCPYVAQYIQRHQEYLPLVPASVQKHLLRD